MENSLASMQDELGPVVDQIIEALTAYGMDVLGALIILLIGFWIAGRAAKLTSKALNRSKHIDDTLTHFFASFVKYGAMVITVVAVLNQFGVQTASLITVLGAAGLAIGLALQGTLSNVAAGVMLLLFRPFKVGDYVEAAGLGGTVKELNLFLTVLATPDNVRITLPNSQIWGAALKNYSANATRRVDIVAGISYNDDIDNAMAVLNEVIDQEARALKSPESQVAVMAMGESSVDIVVRVWVNNADYWGVKFDMTKAIKEAFDAAGITIPFPSRTVYTTAVG